MTTNASKKLLDEKQDFEITEDMEAKMQKRLDAVGKPDEADLEDVPRLEKQEKEDDVKDDIEDVTEDDSKGDVVEDDVVKDDDVKDDDIVKDDAVKDDKLKEHVLPENYFQAMRHVGWDAERIKRVFEKDPEQALEDFKFYHDSQNYVTQQTSDLGRAHKAQTDRATEEAISKESKPEYKGVDLKAIEDELGEDSPAAVAMIKAMNENNKLLFDEIQSLKQQRTEQVGPSDEQKIIWNTIVAHFDSDGMKGFNDFYGEVESGKNWEQGLTGAQLQVRMNVIREADAYHAGMELQGKSVEYSEALRRAHLVVSAPVQEKILREKLHGKIKKRSKGITVKTTGRVAVKDTSKDKDPEKGLIARTKARIKKATGKMPDS